MILEVQRVAKSFGGHDARHQHRMVLDDFSLSLEEHEFVSVIGPSGCGKTTLLRLIAGFDRVDRGRIVFAGREVTRPSAERVVVFQQPGLYPWLDVRRNIAFGMRLARRRIDWTRVDEMIGIVGLNGFEGHPPYELSGGMQQRVALARALIMSPRVLLMDEPFASLDAYLRHSMQEFLLELWERLRTTILFITHDVDEALLLSDRVVVMGSRPGPLVDQFAVDLPRPRTQDLRDDPRFHEMRNAAVGLLGDTPAGPAAPAAPAAIDRESSSAPPVGSTESAATPHDHTPEGT